MLLSIVDTRGIGASSSGCLIETSSACLEFAWPAGVRFANSDVIVMEWYLNSEDTKSAIQSIAAHIPPEHRQPFEEYRFQVSHAAPDEKMESEAQFMTTGSLNLI